MSEEDHSDQDETRQLLRDEYFAIQGFIESFDGRLLTIKTWSVSFSLAAIGSAYAAKAWPLLIVAALSSGLFWCIEGMWKTFQFAYYDRVQQIEAYFAAETAVLVPLQISRSWFASWNAGGPRKLLRIMMAPHVFLPHILALASALILLFFHFSRIARV